MAVELAKGQLLALHFGRLKDQGKLAPEHVSIAKLNSTREALEICRTARTILGGNGISYEFPIMRHMANLESVLTYEGTPEMHTLVIGQALTGHSAFRASARLRAGCGTGPRQAGTRRQAVSGKAPAPGRPRTRGETLGEAGGSRIVRDDPFRSSDRHGDLPRRTDRRNRCQALNSGA